MPTNIQQHRKHYSGNGVPTGATGFNNLATNDTYFDEDNSTMYRWTGSAWVVDPKVYGTQIPGPAGTAATVSVGTTATLPPISDALVTNVGNQTNAILNFGIPKGDKGDPGESVQGPPGAAATVAVGITTTLPAGSQATVTNVGSSSAAVLNFGIPKGADGSGGGGSIPGRTMINSNLMEDFHAILLMGHNSTSTVGQVGVSPSVYAGINVTTLDRFDWANWQYAIYLAKLKRKPVFAIGVFKGIDKSIVIDKDHYNLYVDGFNCEINGMVTSNPFFIFNRTAPTNTNNDWQSMISLTRWVFKNMTINPNTGNSAINTQMQNGSEFSNILIQQGRLGIQSNFVINTSYNNIKVFTPTEGGLSIDNGGFPGATGPNSGSVSNVINNFHLISFGTCEYGIKTKYCEDVVINKPIIEGYLVKKGIWDDGGNDPNFRSLTINNLYCESGMSQGPYTGIGNGQAIVYVRMNTGVVNINGAKSIYPAVLLDAGTGQGRLLANIDNVSWWPHINGKCLYADPATPSSGDVSYNISGWANGSFMQDYRQIVAGHPVTYGCKGDNSIQPYWSICVR
jgi:hypothetical protein